MVAVYCGSTGRKIGGPDGAPKRFDRALINYLTEPEVDALLGCCDQATWTGRRDHALLLLAVQTGLRISELIGLTRADVHLGAGAHVACHGKGRKDRITPLTSGTVAVLREWLTEHAAGQDAPLFATRRGDKLSRDAIEHRLAHVATGDRRGATMIRFVPDETALLEEV